MIARLRSAPALGLAIVAIVVVVMAIVAQIVAPSRDEESDRPALSSYGNDERGARALYLWLGQLGYRVSRIEYRPFAVDPAARVLFVLAPSVAFDRAADIAPADVDRVARWVADGGTLVVAAERSNRLAEHFGAAVPRREDRIERAMPLQPAFRDPPVRSIVVETTAALDLRDPGWVPLLGTPGDADAGRTVVAVRSFGDGRVLLVGAHEPFSNKGIDVDDNWRLVLHALAGAPPGSSVVFDEYHHGLTEHGTFLARLQSEPWGWALIYGTIVVFAYAALQGRRFGRAVVPVEERSRRARSEYVGTIASLLRERRQGDWLRQQYVAQTRRLLGTRFRVPPDLPLPLFVAALADQHPIAATLESPLAALERGGLDDATVVARVRDVDTLVDRLVRSRGDGGAGGRQERA